jgi:hypothetical protein
LTNLTERLSDGERRDVTVTITPGAGAGSPASFLPPAAGIEINADFWPDNFDPRDAWPYDSRDWKNYPAVMGLLIHEVSHSRNSEWTYKLKKAHLNRTAELSDADLRSLGAAELLEESRIEKLQLDDRPQDTPWLQASATTIALAEALGHDEMPSVKAASRVAALVLARASAGSILPGDELDGVRKAVEATIGQSKLAQLQQIWTEFQNTDDAESFMRLGKQWFDLTEDDGSNDDDPGEGGGGVPQELKDALDALADKAMGDASGSEALAKLLKKLIEAAAGKKSEARSRKEAKRTADEVFHGEDAGPASGVDHALLGFRTPTASERRLAHKTARKILSAYIREKAVTTTHSDRPPGRLSPRAAMTGQAQMAMGMYPTVEPFTRKERAHTNSPPLKVGIIQDVSASQDTPAKASASGAYSLAAATKIIPDGIVAMVGFGDEVTKIIGPWEKPKGVPELDTNAGTEYLIKAMKALEGELHLMRQGSARLMVIVTDGMLSLTDMNARDPALKRYLNAGVHVLWVNTGHQRTNNNHLPVNVIGERGQKVHIAYPYMDTDKIPQMINDAAVKALEETR